MALVHEEMLKTSLDVVEQIEELRIDGDRITSTKSAENR
jgi:hypothetical protein